MFNERYEQLCAEQAEIRLVTIEAGKEQIKKLFMTIFGKMCISPDGNYTLQGTWDAIEEAIDDFTHLDRAIAEKTVADYERQSKRSHQQEENTRYAEGSINAH